MKCPSCQFNNPEGMNLCGKCGGSLTIDCPACEHQNLAGSKFCTQCKGIIAHTDVTPAYAKRSALEYTPRFLLERAFKYKSTMIGERKLVSVLFADVADFTAIAEKLDPEDVHEIMDGCFGILGQEIHQAGGTINQYTGDGVMALFGAPIAYDDHIRPACHAALQVQKRMKEFHRKIFKHYGVAFKLRIGIHTGPVVVGAIGDNLRLDYTAVGDTTNLAARLESMAEPGTILVSERVFQNAKGHFLFHNVGQRDVKGKKEPVEVFLLVRERAVKHVEGKYTNTGIPFVDREKEIALLKKAFEKSIEHGPIITAVTGEAGIGKTSLFKHFHQFVVKERALLLEGRCTPYGQLTALFPLKRMFRSYFNLHEQDSDDQVQSKVRSTLKGTEQLASLDHLFDLFSGVEKKIEDFHLAIEWKKKALFKAIRDLLVSISKNKPVIMVINDMQWADASTREYLTFLIQSLERIPVLIICVGRSEPGLWFPDLPMEPIRLNPLSEKQATDLFTSILKTRYFDPDICKKIVSKAGGNPLFLVEMGEALKRQGLIVSEESKCTLKVPVHNIETPESIQGILAARLDALHPELKHLIQLAAVIGQEFSYDLLAPLIEPSENLSNLLKEAVKQRILEPISSDDRQQYQFKQPLMQEVAYHSLLRRDRRRFHQVVGKTIETLYPKNLQANFGLLAHHFYKAKNWPKAFGYTLEATEQASYSYACQEALTIIDRALDIISKAQWERSDKKILGLFLRKGKIHFCMGQMEKAKQQLKAGLKQLEGVDDKFWRPRFLNTLGWVHAETGEFQDAVRFNKQSLKEAISTGDPEIIHNAQINLGENYLALGDLSKAKKMLERVWEEVRKPGISYTRWRYKTRLFIAMGELYGRLGDNKKGLDFIRRALNLARKSGAKKHQALALLAKSRLLSQTRPSLVQKSLEKALTLSLEMGTRLLTQKIRHAYKITGAF